MLLQHRQRDKHFAEKFGSFDKLQKATLLQLWFPVKQSRTRISGVRMTSEILPKHFDLHEDKIKYRWNVLRGFLKVNG